MLSWLKSTWFLCISSPRSACSPAFESNNNFRNSHPNCGLNRSRCRCVTGYSHRIHATVRRSLYRSGPHDRLFRYILNFDLKREAMRKLAALTLSLFLPQGIAFADSPKDADATPAKKTPSEKAKTSDKSDSAIAAEIEELRQTLQSQQEQLQLLKEQLAKRDRQIDDAREAAAAANSRANEANVKASEAVTTSPPPRS